MKKIVSLLIPVTIVISIASCKTLFMDKVSIKEIIAEKEKIESSKNPARKALMMRDLAESKLIVLKNILVKDVTTSTNIDYDFCIIADVETDKGSIECFIFTKNPSKIAKLEIGESRINVEGQFGRFFTTLDKYYTKIEIINSSIDLIEKSEPAPEKTEKETKE